ncbi:hypothetical protein CDD80_3946 [Ophiocordyceps camponoti-rufipedis]|uniref:Uncharacterized protein n=1 Tax=Ophiocordyceps camponoti-rufipedis TaxID=2004952 RepID=A0A2C5YZP2_9HYPO|nr:hypothetical protein CDD80_3946 [Ophiocordyceps camponoti-rufipedis]
MVAVNTIRNIVNQKTNEQHVCEDVLDTLTSYYMYMIARERFVDVLCQQAINFFFLLPRGRQQPDESLRWWTAARSTGRVLRYVRLRLIVAIHMIRNIVKEKSNEQHVCDDALDTLTSYYQFAHERFINVLCQQVVNFFRLEGDDSPIKVFDEKLLIYTYGTWLSIKLKFEMINIFLDHELARGVMLRQVGPYCTAEP